MQLLAQVPSQMGFLDVSRRAIRVDGPEELTRTCVEWTRRNIAEVSKA